MPRISIGLPVYNGENFVKEALDSLLAQTFEDFELIISDNASTDATSEICRAYTAKDPRVRYYRNNENIGAAPNFNRLFELSSGEYFKWAHHDDMCAPEYLERCIEVLDREPSAMICHPKTRIIDEHGNHIKNYDDLLDFRSSNPHERFREYLFRRAGLWNAIWGLIRVSELRKTRLHGSYLASDQVLLGELILRGKIYQVPERLFFRRFHPEQGQRLYRKKKSYAVWFDSTNTRKVLIPWRWKLFFEYLLATRRTQLSWYEQTCCNLYIMKWGVKKLILRPLNNIRKIAKK